MIFSFDFTQEDWRNFNKDYVRFTNRKRFIFMFAAALFAVCCFFWQLRELITYASYYQEIATQVGYFSYADFFKTAAQPLIALALTVYIVWMIRYRMKKFYHALLQPNAPILVGSRELQLTPEKCVVTTEKAQKAFAWAHIQMVWVSPDAIALFYDQNAIILPKNKLDAQTYEKVNTFLEAHVPNKITHAQKMFGLFWPKKKVHS